MAGAFPIMAFNALDRPALAIAGYVVAVFFGVAAAMIEREKTLWELAAIIEEAQKRIRLEATAVEETK